MRDGRERAAHALRESTTRVGARSTREASEGRATTATAGRAVTATALGSAAVLAATLGIGGVRLRLGPIVVELFVGMFVLRSFLSVSSAAARRALV